MFWLVQVLAGTGTITEFIDEQVVAAGGYPTQLGPAISWAVHLGVSLSYAWLAGLVTFVAGQADFWKCVGFTLAAAVVLGAMTAVIAPPAISVTIAVLGVPGWPAAIYPLNTEVGLPFWNHVLLFLLTSLIQMVGPWPTREGQRTTQ